MGVGVGTIYRAALDGSKTQGKAYLNPVDRLFPSTGDWMTPPHIIRIY
jgi:hypothetical protein